MPGSTISLHIAGTLFLMAEIPAILFTGSFGPIENLSYSFIATAAGVSGVTCLPVADRALRGFSNLMYGKEAAPDYINETRGLLTLAWLLCAALTAGGLAAGYGSLIASNLGFAHPGPN